MQKLEDVLRELTEKGIYIFPEPLATKDQIKEMIDLQEKKLNPDDGSYEFGRAGRVGSVKSWEGTAVHDVFNSSVLTDLAKNFMVSEMGGPPSFDELFITHDYRCDQGSARNGFLHFDRLSTFKFFMYLTDCDKDSGAFSYVPDTYQLGKELRTKAWKKTGKYGKIKNRLEIDYPDLGYKQEDAVPVEGPAGTLFAFHSDVFHVGGGVKEGLERRVIRHHYR